MEGTVRQQMLDYGMFERVRQAADWFRALRPRPGHVRVVGDDDPDGVTSAYVLERALRNAGYETEVRLAAIHSEADVKLAWSGRMDAVVLADAGSGLLEEIDATGVPSLVLDHHRVADYAPKNVFEVNPRRRGADKVEHVSASVVCQLFADALTEDSAYSAFAATAGGIADRQHLGGFRGLIGHCLEEATTFGNVLRREGLTLPGRTLAGALAESIDPYFEGLTGDREACERFLRGLKLDPEADPGTVPNRAARELAQELTRRLLAKKVVLDRLYPLYGERAPLKHPSGVPTLFALTRILEALMAQDRGPLALKVLRGRAKAAQTAEKRVKERNKKILLELDRLKTAVVERPNHRSVRTEDEANTGTYAHVLLSFVHGDDKPFLVYAVSGKTAKYSARGSPRLWRSGLDLSIGMDAAAEATGGHGGGHPGAAGASVPRDRAEEFLDRLDAELGRLQKKAPA